MPKAKQDDNDESPERDYNAEEDSDREENDDSDSVELTPVRPKIGESKDSLRQRANWFQKRSGRR